MVACGVCGVDDLFLFRCGDCGGEFCADHQPVDAHPCTPLGEFVFAESVWADQLPDARPAAAAGTASGGRIDIAAFVPSAEAVHPWLPSDRVVLAIAAVIIVAGTVTGAVAVLEPTLGGPLAPVLGGQGAGGVATPNATAVERGVAAETNAFRADNGVPPVEYDRELAAIAAAHSEDMAARNYTSHVSPEGETVADRFDRVGYACAAPSELILHTVYGRSIETAAGPMRFDSSAELSEGVVALWRQSAPHREALLAGSWQRVGVGVVVTDDRLVYVTVNAC